MIPRQAFSTLSRYTYRRLDAPLRQECLACARRRWFSADRDSSQSDQSTSTTDTNFTRLKTSSETRDFQRLLSELYNKPRKTPAPEASTAAAEPKRAKRVTSLIEKRLLEMVLKNRQPHKHKSPLPRSIASPLWGKQETQRSARLEIDAFQDPERIENERLAERDKEAAALNEILACKSSHELSRYVQQKIMVNDDYYPSYYARLIRQAVEQAAIALLDPYLAMAIFEQAKTRSIQSYLSGCTIEVYNTMLMVHWKLWRDVHGMMALVEEMGNNGVGYNDETRRIVQMVYDEVEGETKQLYYNEEDNKNNDDNLKDGLVWSMDERRSANIMKALASKWASLDSSSSKKINVFDF